MYELIQHAYDLFDIDEDNINFINITASDSIILPFADHNLAFDSIEKTVNINEINNDLPRNKYAYNKIFSPQNVNLKSYILILSTELTIDTVATILTIEWRI